ncbi:hypothetical protein [Scatolibacter rhodanostii]|uniref:hypothetical protein n=1 Tax=Scatolibacter rhodanostii TaxID=2014781 RepID=UPI00117F0C1C|nr:hypothetical protein [Scatolibacter rhodanostii]
MDEKNAWENFCKTGKAEDYIKYSQMKNHQMRSGIIQEDQHANPNAGLDYQGADGGRERPFGNGVDG